MRRSLLSNIELSLLALGLVGGGLVACGSDPAPVQQTGDGDGNGDGDGDGGAVDTECTKVVGSEYEARPASIPASEGGGQGYQVCENGEPQGDCKTIQDIIAEALGDASIAEALGDASIPDFSSDASVDFGDGGIPEAKACPSGLMCNVSSITVQGATSNKVCQNPPSMIMGYQIPATAPLAFGCKDLDPCTTKGLDGFCHMYQCLQFCP